MDKNLPSTGNLESPFEKIKHIGDKGNEYWIAREVMPHLEYRKWERFADAIERAMISCKMASNVPSDHFTEVGNVIIAGKGARLIQKDYHLTRYACYLIAMNGDPRKDTIAKAQAYFAAQTRYAEVVQKQEIQYTPFFNNLWRDRAILFMKNTKLPDEYWCIFIEIGHVCWQLELHDIRLKEGSVPDISVGRLWCAHVRGLDYDMSLIRHYPHHYPDHRGIVIANIYPNEWHGEFLTWFKKNYLKEPFKKYLRTHMEENGELPPDMTTLKLR